MPKPELSNKKKWNNSDEFYLAIWNENDTNFKNMMRGVRGRLLHIVASEEYRNNMEENEVDDDNIIITTLEEKKNNNRTPVARIMAYVSKLKQSVANVSLPMRKLTPAERVRFEQNQRNEILTGFRQSENIAKFLQHRDKNGRYDRAKVLRDTAIQLNGSADELYEDLYYMNDKYNMGLDLRTIYPESIIHGKKMSGVPSWGKYMKKHIKDVPYDKKGREEYLAKALVGAFKDHQMRATGRRSDFSVKKARADAEKFMKNEVFIKFCENTSAVNQLIHAARKDPEILHKTAAQMIWPFCDVDQDKAKQIEPENEIQIGQENEILIRPKNKKYMDILKRLRDMADLMDGDKNRSSRWKLLRRSIKTINPGDPALSGEDKLNEIYIAATDYLKDKMGGSKDKAQQKRIEQTLDVLAELAKFSSFAKMKVQTVFDKVSAARLEKYRDEVSRLLDDMEKKQNKLPIDELKGFELTSVNIGKYQDKLGAYLGVHQHLDVPTKQKIMSLIVDYENGKNKIAELEKHYNVGNIKILKYGADRLPAHTNVKDQAMKDMYVQGTQHSEAYKTLKSEGKKVFEVLPEDDASRLSRSDRFGQYKPLKEALSKIRKFVMAEDAIEEETAINQIADAMALSQTHMYYQHNRTTGHSVVVIDETEYKGFLDGFKHDPAVAEIAKKYTAAGSRKVLYDPTRYYLNIDILFDDYEKITGIHYESDTVQKREKEKKEKIKMGKNEENEKIEIKDAGKKEPVRILGRTK